MDVKVFRRLKARLRLDCMHERMRTPDGKMPKHRWASLAVRAVRDLLVEKTWHRAFDTMRIPSDDVPAYSFRRLQSLAPAVGDLPLMPMTPEQLDTMLGRHRISMVPALFQVPIELMPAEDRLALRDRMLADASSAPPSHVGVASRPMSALSLGSGSCESIATRVARRRRTDTQD